jgi:glycopeptide antibiotics resistance protein
MIENIVVFVPFGLLLSVNFKQVTFWRKLALVLILSLAVEATQFVLAIGITDITDVITNTFGVLIGLVLYDLCTKHYDSDKLDRFIAVTVASILILFLLLRIFVFRVRY